ncbi:S-layer homology domain-containing protein [Anoxybacillus sp. LAT_35]|uniref:C40 family peptidase n=1 Tax=unclassified Anoxybacillus TaxID=2639704 RepID=UPI001EDABBBD|nr:C40 family peptidase [Anoxybacillus sp. LAT_26]MCG3084088.1 S-layer homology domain-containing protein [Anoxybacillus sp. LAT27]MCG5026179.1 S-layer homology domain-containing protein [Anoxybacillus flavithermus]MCG6170947.1 S-layer homology domain-containing protein [Anoxybacillus sp. LAT_11]MCG6175840.1 S-layer homology domain-containing protein [Anoxybacillus sp. LAT_31]MCG6178828.1 S-layer homology domain-containing protein [Anoxybacillus sp. LAT_35]MCG6181250.1 S-layer homology domain
MRRFVSALLLFFLFPSFAYASDSYDRLVPLAKKYVGVPYQFGGSSEKGFDCSGFTRHVMSGVGVTLARTTAEQYKQGSAVKKEDLRVGDLVFFETYKKGPSHAGIYIGDNEFIHASSSKGIAVSSLDDSYYKKRYIGARRVLAYEQAAGQFEDIGNDFWANKEIEALGKKEIVLGYAKSYFKPNEVMTRAEAAGLLAAYFKLNMNDRKETFTDVPSDHWAVGAINALVKESIIDKNSKQFQPDEPITREQLAMWFAQAWNFKRGADVPFADVKETDAAYDAIEKLVAAGVANGYEDGTFRPKETVTRAQFAVFFYRAINAK